MLLTRTLDIILRTSALWIVFGQIEKIRKDGGSDTSHLARTVFKP